MLRVDNLKVAPLPPLSFTVANGECLAVEGPSGSGKSRLLRAIADLDEAEGQVFLDGAERHELKAPDWRRRVRYAATEPAWWTDTPRPAFAAGKISTTTGGTVSASVSGKANGSSGTKGGSRDSRSEKLQRLLASLNLDGNILDRPVAELSTGERQRLAFVRAVLDEPSVLLLDEPTNGLDPQTTALVEELIKYQLLAGRSIILASHDAHQIARLAHMRLQLAKPAGPMREGSNP